MTPFCLNWPYIHRKWYFSSPTHSLPPECRPGESDGKPAVLTPLGERLVGLVEWEADGIIRSPTPDAIQCSDARESIDD